MVNVDVAAGLLREIKERKAAEKDAAADLLLEIKERKAAEKDAAGEPDAGAGRS